MWEHCNNYCLSTPVISESSLLYPENWYHVIKWSIGKGRCKYILRSENQRSRSQDNDFRIVQYIKWCVFLHTDFRFSMYVNDDQRTSLTKYFKVTKWKVKFTTSLHAYDCIDGILLKTSDLVIFVLRYTCRWRLNRFKTLAVFGHKSKVKVTKALVISMSIRALWLGAGCLVNKYFEV